MCIYAHTHTYISI
uniref:Uncharacterized protein n=1 Tax=Rhizophora mucronata TaxID=61149 RepID=A0A2P2IY30_RHIMU